MMLVTIGLFLFMAVIVFAVSQWIAPAFYGATTSTTVGFNFGTSFGVPFIKTWGLWVAVALAILGPVAAGWQALTRVADAALGKAFGTNARRGRR
jgi:hypothetical protein